MVVGLYGLYIVGAALSGFWSAFGSFSYLDDEGYVLVSIREFLRLGGLYNHVYSQYGPFPYELWGAVYRVLGLQVTPDNARLIVIVLWVLCGLAGGLVVHRLTHNLWAGLVAAIVIHSTLTVIVNETLIPDDLCITLLLCILAAAVLLSARERLRMFTVGALVGALLLTKVNIGGAVFLGGLVALAVYVPGLRSRPVYARVLILLSVLMPIVLMVGNLKLGWTQNLAVFTACANAGIGVTLWPTPGGLRGADRDWTALKWSAAGLIGSLVILLAIIMALGTSPAQLLDGTILWPLGQPNAFDIAAYLPTLGLVLAVFGLALAFIARGSEWTSAASRVLVGLFRISVGLAILLEGGDLLPLSPNVDATTFALAAPFLWLAIRGRSETHPREWFSRIVVATLPVYGLLFIYPVAGSQNGYAATAFIPAATLILVDGSRGLLAALDGLDLSVGPRARVAGVALAAVLGFQLIFQSAVTSADNYNALTSLPFAGVTHVRQPQAAEASYSSIVGVLKQRCSTFVSYPGMNSFYLWTGMIPPTGLNTTDWMQLLDSAQQQRVVDAAEKIPHVCLLSNVSIAQMWAEGKPVPRRPLFGFVTASDFKPIYVNGGYTVSVRMPK